MTPATIPPRWFPAPILSLLLAGAWLLLNHSASPAHLVAACVLGWGIPFWLRPLLGTRATIRWLPALRLAAIVLWDIVVSNVRVARLALSPTAKPRSAWLVLPLRTDHARANALLATIVTNTPGTVSVAFAERSLLIHVLDCADPAAALHEIDTRYQLPLIAIFSLDIEETPQ
ncbi:Na+/H+ antiporter subunit E [Hydrogenophilus thermoluteolus]|jgi:multicomponent K+:H+ antiporter subunit E|uniref:Monovalent cation/H+ antiporter subunit E n=1 Tax=Hydrogenophilus thermoluteolus TaxID=297 RepID=A0A2Z6DZN3_HYDTE|nr:Na+/H+ antiporter subunit E [Hydrogenophilus thermoluteolus]HCO77272.1 pesticidal protein Cry1Ba [Rhodocyclaceae bacterium]MBW7656335.1 Na+/H+ antiporter subunit E [Hydrogenophilus thermoluteolus]BBD78014.1 monovalent cation/H+ antiporter subunit E [Hydrogenophilus thermoluteolus]GLW60322.1 pesticidal protein Cry1Ba [Hydrogenophilus thermoluteolus]HNQ48717.1 Na+/H+ antiporter subunit E [Hydrogenophilus thermoluteolus]